MNRPSDNEFICTACSPGSFERARLPGQKNSYLIGKFLAGVNVCTRIKLAASGLCEQGVTEEWPGERKKPPVSGRLGSGEVPSGFLGLGLGFELGCGISALVVSLPTPTVLHFVGLSAHNFFTLPNCFCWLARL